MKDWIRRIKKQGTGKLAGALGLLLALGLIFGLIAVPAVGQVPQLPHRLFGEVTVEPCGLYVQENALVSAEMFDPNLAQWVEYASTLVQLIGGVAWYDFEVPYNTAVPPDKNGGDPGDEMRLYVEGILAGIFGDDPDEGGPGFEYGGSDRFDLEVTDEFDPDGTITIGDTDCTNNPNVTLNLTWDDGIISCGVDSMRFSNDDIDWSDPWKPVALTSPWTLTAGDGVKTVYVEFLDGAENNSNSDYTIYDEITLDTTDPNGTIAIGDTECTNSANVTLNLTWDDLGGCDVVSMHFSNDDIDWSDPWKPVALTSPWTLTAGDGVKTVYVEFLDSAGNNSNSDYTIYDEITLDTTDPNGTISINDGAASTTSRNVTLYLTWDDLGGCDVVSMHFSNDNIDWSDPWKPVAATSPWTLTAGDGVKTVYVEFLDSAGNNSVSEYTIYDEIELTTVAGEGIVINEFVSEPGVVQETEWIELFSLEADVTDLTGWTIECETGIPDALDGLSIPANGYLVLQQGIDFFFPLDPSDIIILREPTGGEVDKVAYGAYDDGNTTDNAPAPSEDESTGRCPNGSDTDVDNVDFTVFTTPTPDAANLADPAVTTLAATVVTDVSATLNGSLDDLGCPPDVDVSFMWGTTSGALDQETDAQAMDVTGPFSDEIDGLTPNTRYYFQAKADGGTIYGVELWFDTLEGPPPVPPVPSIELATGWNTFSVPIDVGPDDNTLGDLATMGGLDIEIAWYLHNDGVTVEWIQALDDYVMLPCDAIYVKMNAAGTVPIYPNPGPSASAKDMYPGWNLAGSAFLEESGELPVNQALITLYYAQGELLPWGYTQVISPALNQPGWVYTRWIYTEIPEGTVPNMLVGKGYLVSMDNPDEYDGQTGTPLS